MRRRRSARDHEGLQRVLLLGGVLVGLAGLGIAAWGLVVDGWGLVVGPVLVVFAVACAGRLPRRRPRPVVPGVRGPQPGGRGGLRELRARPWLTRPAALEIVRVGYGHPDAMLLIAEVQAEYVARYGGPDNTPLDPLMFEPPLGSFYVGYLDLDGSRATGRDRRVAGPRRRRGVRHPAHRRDQADVRRPGRPGREDWRAPCWRTSSGPRPRPAPRR